MSWVDIHKDDFGWIGRMTVQQDGVTQDISGFATMKYILIPPSGVANKKELDAAFFTDGADGILTHTFLTGEIDEDGDWKAAPRVFGTGVELTGDEFVFNVAPRLDEA